MYFIIFDFDDTIVDNTYLDVDSFQKICRLYNLPVISKNQIIRWRKNGMLAKNIFMKIIVNQNNTKIDICVKKRLEYLSKGGGGIRFAKMKHNVYKTFYKIKKGKNIVVVITTRENKSIVKEILKKFKIEIYVDKIYTARDSKVKVKTTQDYVKLKVDLYKKALSEFNFKKKEKALVIGNLKTDILAAKKVGLFPIAVKGSYRWDLGIKKMSTCINDISDVIKFL